MATLWKYMAEPSGNPPGPPHACRTRTLRMPTKTPLAGDKIDAPAACAVPFRLYCGSVVTRNVSEYMIVLALCLVAIVIRLVSSRGNAGERWTHKSLMNLRRCDNPFLVVFVSSRVLI